VNLRRERDGLLVRPLALGDAPALHAAVHASIASLSQLFPWCTQAYSLADAEARVVHAVEALAQGTEFAFGVFRAEAGRPGDPLLGCIGLNRFDGARTCANLGYWIGEAHRDRGVATRAAAAAASIGFGELGLARIEIVALPRNVASRRVAEKLGAVFEGEQQSRIDAGGQPLLPAAVYALFPANVAG
jgi:RimJ/RimL family protein N-acetyltransferase